MTQDKTPLYIFIAFIIVVIASGVGAAGLAAGYFWGLADGTQILEDIEAISEYDPDEFDDEYALPPEIAEVISAEDLDDFNENGEEGGRIGAAEPSVINSLLGTEKPPFEDGVDPYERETDPYILASIKTIHPNAKLLPSGVAILNLGDPMPGKSPRATDRVYIEYEGWTQDGRYLDEFLREEDWDRPLPLSKFMPGLAEAIKTMRPYEYVRVWIPQSQAYKGKKGKPKGMLVYDLELMEIHR